MNQMLKTWRNTIFHPSQMTFDKELSEPHATRNNTISWLALGILFAALVNGLSAFLYESFFTSYVGLRQMIAVAVFHFPKENSALMDFLVSPVFGGIVSFASFLIGAPILLFLVNVVTLALAKLLGGTGSFEKQLVATASFAPGLFAIANFFGIVRQFNICIASPALWIYAVILSILAVKSIHGLSTAKSSIAVIISFLVFTVTVLVLFPPSL